MILYWATAESDIERWKKSSQGIGTDIDLEKYQITLYRHYEQAVEVYANSDKKAWPVISVECLQDTMSLLADPRGTVSVPAWNIEYTRSNLDHNKAREMVLLLRDVKKIKIDYDMALLERRSVEREKALERSKDLLRQEIVEREKALSALEKRLRTATTRMDFSESQNDKLREEITYFKEESEGRLENCRVLTQEKNDLESEIASLNQQIDAINDELELAQQTREQDLERLTQNVSHTLKAFNTTVKGMLKAAAGKESKNNENQDEKSRQNNTKMEKVKSRALEMFSVKNGLQGFAALGIGFAFFYGPGMQEAADLLGSYFTVPFNALVKVGPLSLFSGIAFSGIKGVEIGLRAIREAFRTKDPELVVDEQQKEAALFTLEEIIVGQLPQVAQPTLEEITFAQPSAVTPQLKIVQKEEKEKRKFNEEKENDEKSVKRQRVS